MSSYTFRGPVTIISSGDPKITKVRTIPRGMMGKVSLPTTHNLFTGQAPDTARQLYKMLSVPHLDNIYHSHNTCNRSSKFKVQGAFPPLGFIRSRFTTWRTHFNGILDVAHRNWISYSSVEHV
jgi:hypothetical protein